MFSDLPGDDPGAGGDAVLPSTGNGAHQNNTVGNIPAAQDQGQAKAQGQRKNRGQKAKTKVSIDIRSLGDISLKVEIV